MMQFIHDDSDSITRYLPKSIPTSFGAGGGSDL